MVPIVTIKNGKIRGFKSMTKDLKISYKAFRGIPYAEPPLNDLRFEPPIPKSNWDNILDTIDFGNACVQSSSGGSEDCLFLNVYVPEIKTNNAALPVLVWIHGGGFVAGSPYEQPDYLIEKGLIFVSLNYRLGIFGFISTGDLVAPGNVGLKDQVLALKWVHENIKFFGGDPKNVTLFGESSGSMAVSYHLQSNATPDGLFQKAIMNSGVSLCPTALSDLVPEATRTVAGLLKINYTDSKTLIEGLKQASQNDLQQAAKIVMDFLLQENFKNGFVFGPVVEPEHENAFFTGNSQKLLETGNFKKVPILLGFNQLEGALDLTGLFRLLLLLQFDMTPELLVPKDMGISNEEIKKEVAEKIRTEYFGTELVVLSNMTAMKWITDDQFIRPIREFARLTSKFTKTFLYYFTYKGRLGDPDFLFSLPTHAEELRYLFVTNNTGNQTDYLCRDRLTTLWTNFVKFANPTPQPNSLLLENIIWSNIDVNLNYLKIDKHLEVAINPENEKMLFWDDLYEKYGNLSSDRNST